jgi:hypothetical protein
MKSCPACDSALSEGVVTVKGLTPQFFMPVFADQDLWFVRQGGKKKIVPSAEQRRAFLCETCGTVCIVPNPQRPRPDVADMARRVAARFSGPRTKDAAKGPKPQPPTRKP